MAIELAYAVFLGLAMVAFRFCQPAVAVLGVFLGGWIFLPNGHYPQGASLAAFPYWITGLAVPSDMLVTKAWIAPLVALLGAMAFDRSAIKSLRWTWFDLPIVLWCLWPLLAGLMVAEARPQPWVAALYLLGTWGVPWLLGRLYFGTPQAQVLLIKGLVVSAAVCLPFSLIEGLFGPTLYGLLFESHPFRLDGDVRYLGYRPIGFFEHGNQFGFWISMSALAALWFARSMPEGRASQLARFGAVLVTGMAIAAQSVGAILMLGMGAGLLWVTGVVSPRRLVAGALAVALVLSAIYLAGVVPVMRIGKESAIGQSVVNAFRAMGRGSFTWRISQDQKLLKDATAQPVSGSGQWDWWRSKEIRPWGLWMLMIGQFGFVGLMLSLAVLIGPALRVAWEAPRASGWRPQGLQLLFATIATLTAFDAFLNSFIFFPALLMSGALAAGGLLPRRPRGEITRIRARA